jgi:hypothetical protein
LYPEKARDRLSKAVNVKRKWATRYWVVFPVLAVIAGLVGLGLFLGLRPRSSSSLAINPPNSLTNHSGNCADDAE